MTVYSALIGDLFGSVYEFNNIKSESWETVELVTGRFTDDSMMTMATMDWLASSGGDASPAEYYKLWGRTYANAGYGPMFWKWLTSGDIAPYGSFGNGSAMRVSPVAYWAKSLDECVRLAYKSAEVTHNDPEGLKGAACIAGCAYLASVSRSKADVKAYAESLGYDVSRKITEIGRATHKFDATCQVTVPEAVICVLDSNSFEECMKKCIWIGGDSDTICAMAAPIADALWGVPEWMKETATVKMDKAMKNGIEMFENAVTVRTVGSVLKM